MIITCKNCKQEVDVSMCFYNAQIKTHTEPLWFSESYVAIIDGKAICPCCGNEIREIFHSGISEDDILWLAAGVRRKYNEH